MKPFFDDCSVVLFSKAVREEGIDIASRAEEGNYKYEFYASAENDTDLLLLEYWKDRAAHALHRTLPHYIRLGELKEVYDVADEA